MVANVAGAAMSTDPTLARLHHLRGFSTMILRRHGPEELGHLRFQLVTALAT